MYCSIQEAYNEPSFSKQKKTTPNKMQCGVNGTPTPNNMYTNQSGQEHTAYQHKRQTPGPSKQVQSPRMVENFMCGGPAAAIPSGSTGKMSQQVDPITGNIPYSAQANDYKYYCDNMGICPTPKISIEGFTDNYGSESYLEPASYNTQKQRAKQQPEQNQDGIPPNWQPQQSIHSQDSCQISEQSTTYTYPISDDTKRQYEAAMKVYLNNGQSTPQQSSASPTNNSMNNITGLYDDEINQYMRVQDMELSYPNSTASIYANSIISSQQVPKPPEKTTPQPFDDNHILSSPSQFTKVSNNALANAQGKMSTIHNGLVDTPPQQVHKQHISNTPRISNTPYISNTPQVHAQTPSNGTNKWQYIMDTILFISAGVLIIVLCDLLFKVAYSIGMKDTFLMMKPYLSEIEELKAKIAQLIPDEIVN